MEEAGSPGCRPGVSGEVLLLYDFLSIPPILLLLRVPAFSKEGGPACTAKGSPLYSYGVHHTRANIFLGFFQSWKASGRVGKSLPSQVPTLMDQQRLPGKLGRVLWPSWDPGKALWPCPHDHQQRTG